MLSRKVQKYIKDHFFLFRMSFQRLGIFLNLLYAEGVHISSILWWDHCKVSEQCFSVGGGYGDPENPKYMYTETQRWKDDFDK